MCHSGAVHPQRNYLSENPQPPDDSLIGQIVQKYQFFAKTLPNNADILNGEQSLFLGVNDSPYVRQPYHLTRWQPANQYPPVRATSWLPLPPNQAKSHSKSVENAAKKKSPHLDKSDLT